MPFPVYPKFRIFLTTLAASVPLCAAVYTVDVTTDGIDSNTADGVCATAADACTLRAAVMQANAHAGLDTIELGTGTYRLSITGTGEDNALMGDLDVTESLIINGSGMEKSIIDAQQVDRVFHLIGSSSEADVQVTFNDFTIRNGMISGTSGGGVNADYVTFTFNRVKLADNSVGGSTSSDIGGGLRYLGVPGIHYGFVNDSLFSGNSAERGGGIFSNGSFNLSRSTLAQNTARTSGGAALFYGSATLAVSTFSGNSAGNGGAITNVETLGIYYCTFSNNSAPVVGAAIHNQLTGVLSIDNTIIANSTGSANCQNYGTITSIGHNLEDADSCDFNQTSDLVNTDPMLLPLDAYGGPTPTHALRAGSPAVDAGLTNTCFALDQRGVHRPQGSEYDIGAFEWAPITVPAIMYLLD